MSAFPPPALCPKGSAVQLQVDGAPYLILGGELHNSSASSTSYMRAHVWERVAEMGCNTVLAPVYWELVEPREGEFCFDLVDDLLADARQRGLRLVLLWFGTWKNGASTYTPAWVKLDGERFFRCESGPGITTRTLSPFCDAAREADARAFARFMQHLAGTDASDRTVVLVQVENEAGLLRGNRDHSPAAEAAYHAAIPKELAALLDSPHLLHPDLRADWERAGARREGNWPEVFGDAADEVFMAWHTAGYIQRVAAAGRSRYALPCFANAWIVHAPGDRPGVYPSGGPTSRVQALWEWAAPDIAFLSPDIYLDDFAAVCREYRRPGRAFFIPEAKRDGDAAANLLCAIGGYHAIGFAPFGIESMESPLYAATCRLLREMAPLILEHQGSERLCAILQRDTGTETLTLGNYHLSVHYHHPRRPGEATAAALLLAPQPDHFIVAGFGGIDINFTPRTGHARHCDFLSVEEGCFERGVWHPRRRLNGDEYVLRLAEKPTALQARLYTYP